MDLTISKNHLLPLLRRCIGTTDPKGTMPMLGCLLLDATGADGTLHCAATDLYLSMSASAPAEVKARGSICLPARDLVDRVKAMPDGPIRIHLDDRGAAIIQAKGTARRFTMQGQPGAEFPTLPTQASDALSFAVPVDSMRILIARTLFSVSEDDTRANVCGAFIELGDGSARMVSTDGHRLSRQTLPLADEGQRRATMLIPRKAIHELRRLCDEAAGAEPLRVALSGPNAIFTLPGLRFTAKIIDAAPPPYDAVIPATSERELSVAREPLADAIRAVALAANGSSGGIRLAVKPGAIVLSSEGHGTGSSHDEVPADYAGPEFAVGLNGRYALDVLDALDHDSVRMSFSGELDPIVVRPCEEKPEAGEYIAVVMPLRL